MEEVMKNLMGEVEVEGEEEVQEPDSEPKPEEPEVQEVDTSEEVPKEEAGKPEKDEKKDRPFHKNPKFIRLQKERDEAIRQREEERKFREQMLQELQSLKSQPYQFSSQEDVPEDLKHIFGDDVAAYKSLQKHLVDSYRSVAKQETEAWRKQEEERQRIERESQAKIIAEAEAKLEELAEETGVDFSSPDSDERNRLLDICEQYGINDFQKAYALYEKLYAGNEVAAERKKLAGNTSSKTIQSAPSVAEDVMTRSKLKKVRYNSFFN